jgi:hypothetical protein
MGMRKYGKVRFTSNEIIDAKIVLALPAFAELMREDENFEESHAEAFSEALKLPEGTVLDKGAWWVGFKNCVYEEYDDGVREYTFVVDGSWNSLYSELFIKYVCELGMGVEAVLENSSGGGGSRYDSEMESGVVIHDPTILTSLRYLGKVSIQSQRWEETLEILQSQDSDESKLSQIRELTTYDNTGSWSGRQL